MLSSAFSRSPFARRGHSIRSVALAMAPVLMIAAGALADPVLVTSNTTLTSSDTLFPGTSVPVALAEKVVEEGRKHAEWEEFSRMRLAQGGDMRKYYPLRADAEQEYRAWRAPQPKA